jgi:hypothetical protein
MDDLFLGVICAGIILLVITLALRPKWWTRIAGMPSSLAIALWVTGSCWAVAATAYFLDVETKLLASVFAFGVVTGAVEWLLRRKK